MTLERDLADTAAALESGWPIQNINRLRRAQTMADKTDTTAAILDEITRIHSHARKWEWPPDGDDLFVAIKHYETQADDAAAILTSIEKVLRDAGDEIARLSAECAGLRARK